MRVTTMQRAEIRWAKASYALAQSLEKHLEIVLVDLEDAGVEGTVPRSRITSLLRIQECKAELAADSRQLPPNTCY